MQGLIEKSHKKKVVIGGGPAGLTSAYELSKAGVESVRVLEKDHMVGGLARTINYKNYHFDIGGHRFFTEIKRVEDMWRGSSWRRSSLLPTAFEHLLS